MPGLDSEAVMLAVNEFMAISNDNELASTSQNSTASNMLRAIGLRDDRVKGAPRFSWCYLTPKVDWEAVAIAIKSIGAFSPRKHQPRTARSSQKPWHQKTH